MNNAVKVFLWRLFFCYTCSNAKIGLKVAQRNVSSIRLVKSSFETFGKKVIGSRDSVLQIHSLLFAGSFFILWPWLEPFSTGEQNSKTALNQTGCFQTWREISAVQGIAMSYCRHSGLQISLIHCAALKAPCEDRGCALHLLRPMDLAHQKKHCIQLLLLFSATILLEGRQQTLSSEPWGVDSLSAACCLYLCHPRRHVDRVSGGGGWFLCSRVPSSEQRGPG